MSGTYMKRLLIALGATGGLFLIIQLGALALVEPFMLAGYQPVEDPGDPLNVLLFVIAILLITALMLVAIRFGIERLIQGVIIFATIFVSYYVLSVLLPAIFTVLGINVPAIILAIGIGLGLLIHPEWYVIDIVGVILGAGAAALFGISFGMLPALGFLVILAIYDAISVYKTEHMLTLASGVLELRLPIVLVIPLSLSYSFLDQTLPESLDGESATETVETEDTEITSREPQIKDIDSEEMPERDAVFIGLGDAIIPTILVVSAAYFQPGSVPLLDVPIIALTLPAVGAIIGTLLGLSMLQIMVMKGRAHAGLPLLNGGAIAGYLVAALLIGIPLVEAIGLSQYL